VIALKRIGDAVVLVVRMVREDPVKRMTVVAPTGGAPIWIMAAPPETPLLDDGGRLMRR
jgi:hypothetical protein